MGAFERTQAYSFNVAQSNGIMINLAGREPTGIVKPEEYVEVRNRIIKELNSVVDEQEGRKVIDRVFRMEEIYWGPHIENAPDIIFAPLYEYVISDRIRDQLVKEKKRVGRCSPA